MSDDFNSQTARQEILNRIRTMQGRKPADKPLELAKARQWVSARVGGPRPPRTDQVLDQFCQRSLDMLCTLDRVSSEAQALAACQAWIQSHGLAGAGIAVWPELKALDWAGTGLSVRFGKPLDTDLTSITSTAYAVAETGTLVLCSSSETPTSAHLLPQNHVALVKASQVEQTLEDVFARMRREGVEMPRALNCVSGPSRTADIEQTIVLGAHGPFRVHLIVIEGL
ncbi:MAG: lactate utilization protein C [Limnobacter sp.]|uniref:LutC/YkgG family protein n=1 Tax=Limnobacter sp. TaxID=2003368 RepID=UPI00391D1145